MNALALYLGGLWIHFFTYIHAFVHLSWQSLLTLLQLRWLARPAVRFVVIRQIYFTGVQGLIWVLLMALVAGFLAVFSIVVFAQQVQDLTLIGSLIGGILLQEVAPLLIAFFLLLRSGVAVVTEVGNIQARGEPAVLHSLGIPADEYLLMPRLLGFVMSGLILTVVFALLAVWLGGLLAAITNTLHFSEFMFEIRRGIDFSDVLLMLGKSILYPALIISVLISQGNQVGDDPNQIPVRATYGMLGSLALIMGAEIMIFLLQLL